MKKFMLILMFLMVGCAPSAGDIETAIAQTQASLPTRTNTPRPTQTKRPTSTKRPPTVYVVEVGFCFLYTNGIQDVIAENGAEVAGCTAVERQRMEFTLPSEVVEFNLSLDGVYPYCAFYDTSGKVLSVNVARQTRSSFSCFQPSKNSSPTKRTTASPAVSNTPAPTQDRLKIPKIDGFYLVGEEIAPGVWRSQGKGESCYWSLTTKTGDIISNHFGMSGGTMYVPQNAFQVQVEGCGTWVFLSEP
jgi:hypothetical protein